MPETTPAAIPLIRKILPYTSVAAVLAVLYMGWVFYSRWSTNQELQREAEAKSTEQSRKTYELYGSGQLKLMLFYAVPPTVAKGQTTQLCYSVSNATKVKIDNGVEDIKPSLNHCVVAKPVKSTSYTITASDDQGHEATKSVDVVVK